jgi:hypothetical protein
MMSEEALTVDAVNHVKLIHAKIMADEQNGQSTPVRIKGLINRPELNGRMAKIIRPKPGDPLRIIVSLWPDDQELGLRYTNVELIQAEDSGRYAGRYAPPLDQLLRRI